MKKIVSLSWLAATISFVTLLLVSCAKKTPPMVVLTTGEVPPFSMVDKDGKISGFDIDLIKLITKKMKREIEIKQVPFEDLLSSLQSKKGDIAISAISVTDERKKNFDLSPAYHKNGFVLLVPVDMVVNGLEDFAEKIIGVRAGTLQEDVAKSGWERNIRNLFVKSFSKLPVEEIVNKLESGELAAVLLDTDEAVYITRTNSKFKVVPLDAGTFDIAIATFTGSPYSTEIASIMIENKDEIDRLKMKWFSAASN